MRYALTRLAMLTGLLLTAVEATAVQFLLFPFDPHLSAFVQSYLEDPQPTVAIDRYFEIDMDSFLRDASAAQQPHSRAVLMAFYAQILHANPELVMPFAERLVSDSTGSKAAFGSEVVAYGASSHRAEALELIAESFDLLPEQRASLANVELFPYPRMKARNWQDLDILWASFFATRDSIYIRAISEPLNEHAVPSDSWMQRAEELSKSPPAPQEPDFAEWIGLLTAKAALFGLTVNAAQYPAVLDELATLAEQSTRAGELSKKIVAGVKARGTGAP